MNKTDRVIETGKYRRPGATTLVEIDTHEAFLADYFAHLPPDSPLARERDADHHWNERHPRYDPTCTCGDSTTAERKAAILATVNAVTEFDGPDMPGARQAKNEARRGRRPMSPGQKGYLEGLARRLLDLTLVDELRKLLDDPDTTWAQASAMIDRMKQAISYSVRPNRFAQPCRICGQTVAAEAGHLSKDDYGRWLVEHIDSCPEPPEEPSLEDQAEAAMNGLDLTFLPAGRYAVPGGDTRLKIRIDKPNRGNWSGHVFVKDAAEYGTGKRYGTQRPGQRYQGEIEDELRAIMADPRAAMAAYGHLTNTCGNCGRALEDETSVELGIGPVCRKGLGWG